MNNQEKPTTAAEITEEMIAAWKKKNPAGVFAIIIDDKKGFVRRPNRLDLQYAMSYLKGGGELKMVETLLEEIWLGGDQEILTDDEYFLGACMQIQGMVQVRQAELVKY